MPPAIEDSQMVLAAGTSRMPSGDTVEVKQEGGNLTDSEDGYWIDQDGENNSQRTDTDG